MFSEEVLFYEHGYITGFETRASERMDWEENEYIYGFRARFVLEKNYNLFGFSLPYIFVAESAQYSDILETVCLAYYPL